MGKAKITSGGPAGLYNIELVKDTARITYAIKTIDARLPLLVKAIDAILLEKTAAQSILETKRSNLDDAVGKLILGQTTGAQVDVVQKEFLAALATYETKSVAYSLLLQEQESKTKAKKMLQDALKPEYRNNVWCADLTEDLAAGLEVSTIEINGEATLAPIIYPGGAVDKLPTSKLQPTPASTPAGVFVNAAKFAAWERWKPTYRIGTIISISGDYCDVVLDAARSTVQKLNINPLTVGSVPLVLRHVPIYYMGFYL